MVAAAIVVGAAVATVASTYGVKLELNNFTKSLFYYLFMYGVGLRVGPSFINSLKGDGAKFAFLAVLCSVLGLALAVAMTRVFDLPLGAAGGILAGAMTMSAAIGSAEQAVTSGVVALPEGMTAEQVSAMIALSYGVTYICGTVGIILICKYLPKWWGVDARAAAKRYEEEFGVKNLDESGLTGYRPAGIRAYRVTNPETAGNTVAQFRAKYPMYRVINVVQGNTALAVTPDVVLEPGSVVALGGRLEDLTERMGLIGPEVADQQALNIPLDAAEILVTNEAVIGKALKEFRHEEFAGQVQLVKMERGGMPLPLGLETTLQRLDVMYVAGLKTAVNKAAELFGRAARPSTATDLLTLALGMILGFLIGKITVDLAGSAVGLGNAGGLLVSGVIVSSLVSRLRFFGNTPNAARNILEDLGLVVFIAIVGVNAGATLLEQLTGSIALYIFTGGVHRLHHPADCGVGHRLPRVRHQPRGADGRRRRCTVTLRAGARSGGGNRQQRSVDWLPRRLRRVGRTADRVRVRRDGVVVTVHLNLLFTILAALVVLPRGASSFADHRSCNASASRRRWSAACSSPSCSRWPTCSGVRVSFDMSLRDNLLLMFFTTVGLSADARMLLNGGPKLLLFLGISAVFIAVQNLVGIAAALAMDLHPLVGLLGGSITLTGGHGTGAAYGGRFGDTMNLVGAMELTMACATAGLVLGSLLGGPLAEFLITRYQLSPTAVPDRGTVAAAARRGARSDHRAVGAEHACSRFSRAWRSARCWRSSCRAPGSSCRTSCSACCSASSIRNARDVRSRRPLSAARPSISSAACRCRCSWSWR